MVSDIACYGNCAVKSQCTEGLGWFRVEGVGQKVLFSYFAVRFLFSFFSPFHPYLIFISSLSLYLLLLLLGLQFSLPLCHFCVLFFPFLLLFLFLHFPSSPSCFLAFHQKKKMKERQARLGLSLITNETGEKNKE